MRLFFLYSSGVYYSDSSGVEFSTERGLDGLHHYELKILNVPCYPGCEVLCQIESSIGSSTGTSPVFSFTHGACGISIQEGF